MIYLEFSDLPEDFEPSFEAVGGFLENEGEILLLLRRADKSQGNTWGIPTGKIEAGETPPQAMARELQEETGYDVCPLACHLFQKIYVRYEGRYDFIYYIFHIPTETRQCVKTSPSEHQGARWMSPSKALEMHRNYREPDLVEDLDCCIELFYGEWVEISVL